MNGTIEFPSRGIVYGQLIDDCLYLPPDRRRRDLPVILLLGTRRNGKTELLKEIRRRAGVRPRVLRDLGSSELRPHEVAVALAFGLSAKAGQFGRLQFPRLALGLVAIRIDADLHNPEQARRNLRSVLSRDRRGLIAKLRAVTEGLPEELGAPAGAGRILGLVLEGLGALWTKKSLRGRPFMWYRDALDVSLQDPLDTLLELNLLEAQGTQEGRDEIDVVLCRAFLADLRDAFTTGWRAKLRTGNCLTLIDNADSSTGQAFLRILVNERGRHAESRYVKNRRAKDMDGDCDPLVVVATGRTWFPEFALREDGSLLTRSTRQATYDDWASSRGSGPKSWLYPVELGDLDAREDSHEDHPELSALARMWPQVSSAAYVVRKLHELTYGHLQSSDLVLRAIADAVERDGARDLDLRGILDWPDPEDRAQNVAGGAIDRLLPGMPSALLSTLTTCAAAPAVGSPWPFPRKPDEFCNTSLWTVRVGPVTARRFVLHPFLRRVLLYELAKRDRWKAVHSRLRTHYKGDGNDLTLALYHTLALGELAPVVARLAERFAELDASEWLRLLRAVTAAPRRAGPADQTPEEQAWALAAGTDAGGGDVQDVLVHLVPAMWISKDPLGDPNRTLDVFITAHLNNLAGSAGSEAGVLLHEAKRYDKRGQRECWARYPPIDWCPDRQDANA